MLEKLSGPVLILGSRLLESDSDYTDVDGRVSSLFPSNIEIKPPENEAYLVSWKSQLEEDMKMIQIQDNKNHITKVLAENDLECDDLGCICLADSMVLSNHIEKIIVLAVSYHLMNNKEPEYRNGKPVISSKSLSHGLSIFQECRLSGEDTIKLEANVESGKEAVNEDGAAAAVEKVEGGAEVLPPENKSEAEKMALGVKDSEAQEKTEFSVSPTNMMNEMCYFSHYIEITDTLTKSMFEEQKATVAETLFGHLLQLLYIKQSRPLLNVLLFFWDDDNESFRFDKTVVLFMGIDIALILSLRATDDEVELYREKSF